MNLPADPEPTPTITLSTIVEAIENEEESTNLEEAVEPDAYDGIDWMCLPEYQQPHRSLKRSPSWIWKFGYRIQEQKAKGKMFWVCGYCHQHCQPGSIFNVTLSTTSAAKHLA